MSEPRVVQAESGREVRQSYWQGCHDYTIGFSCPLFWAAALCGYGVLWKQHVPEPLYRFSAMFFVVFSVVGFAIVLLAYTKPIWFYELLEADTDDTTT